MPTIKARQIQKNDTSANWEKATNFTPKLGELILYTDLNKIKIGNGTTNVNDLPFVTDNYVSKSGDTMTGPLIVPQVQTGSDAANYFQCQKFRGQGNADSYYHAIDFGYNQHNQVDFHEYGGIWNFYKNTTGAADGGTLVASIKEDGFHGNMADYKTETWTFTLANGSTVTKNVVIK